jgi:hypothetical protein
MYRVTDAAASATVRWCPVRPAATFAVSIWTHVTYRPSFLVIAVLAEDENVRSA